MWNTKMKVVFLLVNLSILLVSALKIAEATSPEYIKPKISSVAETILQVGDNFTVLCEGNKLLNWSWPEVPNSRNQDRMLLIRTDSDEDFNFWTKTNSTKNDEDFNDYKIWTKIHVTKDIPKDKSFKYAERLFLQNVTYPFTGFYKCFDGNSSDSIYLYIKDEKHPSVKADRAVDKVKVNQFSETVIPCRPTSPDVRVELSLFDKEKIILDEILEDGRIYHYHPHFGFITNFTTPPEELFECTFIGNSSTTNFFVMDLDLVKFAWTTPNGKPDGKRIEISRQTTFIGADYIIHNDYLTINNASLKDSGVYYCNGSDEYNRHKIISFNVTINDTNDHFINLTEANNMLQLHAATGEAFVQWTVKVKAHPKAILLWLDNKNETIEKSDKYYTQLTYSTAILKIKNITSDDNGYYTLVAYNEYEDKSIVLFLNVTDRPLVESISDSHVVTFNKWLICIIAILLLLVISISIFQIIKVRNERKLQNELRQAGLRDFEKGALENLNSALGIATQAEFLPYDKKWEFPLDKLKLNKQLGSGAFGVVIEAEAEGIVKNGKTTKVAVKMLKKNVDRIHIKALVCELKILIHLGQHLNVVNLIGAYTKDITKGELYIIVEYCSFGNVRNYLLSHTNNFINQIDQVTGEMNCRIEQGRTGNFSSSNDEIISRNHSHESKEKTVCTKDLLIWAFQVARGMEYLVSRRVLHGDLAARNILLTDNNVIKICDFGFARRMCKSDNYKKKTEGPLPIKWMALESIADLTFSTQSDVWSFGIVLWEFFSLAKTPYPGISICDLYIKLTEGYRMESPEYATKKIYEIMLACWEADPEMRPSFSKLIETIGSMLEDTVRSHYIDLNNPYLKMNTQRLESGQTDYLSMLNPSLHEKLSAYSYINDLKPADEDSSGYLRMVKIRDKNVDQTIDDASAFSYRNLSEKENTQAKP